MQPRTIRWGRLLAPLLALSALATAPHPSTSAPPAPGQGGGNLVPMESADCLACDNAIDGEGMELVHRGRRVRLHPGDCLAHWESDSTAMFAQLQPHAALWDEVDPMGAMRGGWFWFGIYVLVGLVSGAFAAYIAINRGLPALEWFFLGLAFNVLALAGVLMRPKGNVPALEGVPTGLRKVPVTRSPLNCTSCGNANHPSAAACAGCGATLAPKVDGEMLRVRGGSAR